MVASRLRCWLYALGTLSWVAVVGCASREPDWSARRGQYTYEEAVRQYGAPVAMTATPDGGRVGYWNVPDARTYAFRFQLPEFDGNSEGSLNPGTAELPPGGRHLGTVGRPVLQLNFDSDDRLTGAERLKEFPPSPVAVGATNAPAR